VILNRYAVQEFPATSNLRTSMVDRFRFHSVSHAFLVRIILYLFLFLANSNPKSSMAGLIRSVFPAGPVKTGK
jgi:hypothetical protein